VPNFNLGFKIKCKVSRKNLETKNQKKILCRVLKSWHSAKTICAECPTSGARQRLTMCTTVNLCRVSRFAECPILGKDHLCRVRGCAECLALGKELFAESRALPSAALGKEALCRVPDFWRSAKHLTLGKARLCCSEWGVVTIRYLRKTSWCSYSIYFEHLLPSISILIFIFLELPC